MEIISSQLTCSFFNARRIASDGAGGRDIHHSHSLPEKYPSQFSKVIDTEKANPPFTVLLLTLVYHFCLVWTTEPHFNDMLTRPKTPTTQ